MCLYTWITFQNIKKTNRQLFIWEFSVIYTFYYLINIYQTMAWNENNNLCTTFGHDIFHGQLLRVYFFQAAKQLTWNEQIIMFP